MGRTRLPIPMLEDIKKTLWATADKLRANMDVAECVHCFFGRLFLARVVTQATATGMTEDNSTEPGEIV